MLFESLIPALARIPQNTPIEHLATAVCNHNKTILIGIGKCHLVANLAAKIANSFSLRWHSIDAVSALHGDIGLIHKKDLVVYLTASGATWEVQACARNLEHLDSIALTCVSPSPIMHLTDAHLHLPCIEGEGSLFGKAPMVSSLLFLSVLYETINRVAEISITEEQYLSAHPHGAIGQTISI